MASNAVTLKFIGDTRDLDRSFRTVQAETGKTESRFAKFSSAMKPLAVAAGTAIAVNFGKASVDAFRESEESQNRLQQAFRKFKSLSDINIGSLQKLNTELSKKTKFDDDATASGQAVLAQFGLTGKQIKTLTPLLQDYAAKTGKDLPTAAQDLGKAVLGQGKALKAIGIDFADTESKAGNLQQVMTGLRQKVGGFATAEGKTAAGQAQILSNQFGELQEKVGSVLVPALLKLSDILLKVVNWFQELPGPAQAVIGVIAGLAAGVFVVTKAIQAWTAVQAALNAVMALNPVVLIVAAIAALVAGVIIAYQHSQTFRDVVQSAWDVIKGAAQFIATVAVGAFNLLKGAVESVVGFISRNWPLLLAILTGPIGLAVKFISEHFDGIVSFIGGLPARIGAAAKGMWDGIKNAFKDAINFIIRAWNGLEFKVPSVEVFGKKLGGFTLGVPDIPTLHGGGTFHAPTPGGEGLALLRDGERVTPFGFGRVASGSTVVNINMPPGSDGDDVVAAIMRWERRNGTSWRR